jgi:hypothetical protein
MLMARLNTRELDAELRMDKPEIPAQESGDGGDEELCNPSLGVDEAPTNARRGPNDGQDEQLSGHVAPTEWKRPGRVGKRRGDSPAD